MNKDDATELLPCPFCGSTASFTEDNSPIRDNKTVWLVGCDSEDCPAMPLLCGNARKVDAAKAWNSRTASVPRWTRVEDGLPEKAGRYLITRLRKADGRHLTREAFFDYEFTRTFAPFDPIKDVIAWMPKPKPYTEDTDEQR